jgi:hypothetical protein
MAHQGDEDNRLRAFEAALAALTPRSDRLARDRLMFLAGQASATAAAAAGEDSVPLLAGKQCAPPQDTACEQAVAHGRVRAVAWQMGCGVSTLAAAVLLVLWLHKPAPEVVERVVEKTVYVTEDVAAPSSRPTTVADSRDPAGDPVDGFSSRRRRFQRPAPGWWALLGGATDSVSALASPGGDSSIAALYAQLHDGPAGLDLRDVSTEREFRVSTAAGDAALAPAHPATQIELRDELLRGGPQTSPAAPKSTIQPKGERS